MKGIYFHVLFVLFISINTARATNVVIIESESFNAGQVMDNNWLSVCTGLGYTAAIYPQTQLDVNTWFGTTDVLIVSSGVINLPANRIATIQAFLQQGGRVYLQTEYLSSYTSDAGYQQIVNAMGGNFTWGVTYSGTLAPMVVSGSLSTTPNAITPLTYFWYGVNGATAGCDSHIEPFLTYQGVYFGFIFCVPANNARMITTCDQDWVNQLTSTALMQNIAINLAGPTYTCVVASGGLSVNLGPDTTLCNGQQATFDASTAGATSYLWSNNATTASITVSTAGAYSVTVSNGSCTAYDTVVVSTGVTPSVTIAAPVALSCASPTEILSVSSTTAGTTFNWSNGINAPSNSITSAGVYVVTATAPSGCTAVTSTNVTADTTSPNAGATSAGPLSCINTTDVLTATSTTPNATFNWTGGGTNNPNYAVISPGNYTVTVTDPANGCTNTATVNVTQTTVPPTVSIAAPVVLTCAVTGETLTASSGAAGATYSWSNGINTEANAVSAPAIYYVTVTDPATGCTNTDSVTVSQSVSPPQVSILPAVVLTCATTNETLIATSSAVGSGFVWSNGTVTSTTSVSSGGNYTVTATDPANGCTASAFVTVAQDTTSPGVFITPPAQLTCTVTSVQLNASSNVAGATYTWSTTATTSSVTTSSSGNYSVTATDPSNQCTATISSAVIQNITAPVITIAPPASLTCNASSITLTASSSAAITNYSWSTGGNTDTSTVSAPGAYQVSGTDPSNGCSSSATTTVNSIAPPVLTYNAVNITCFGGSNGSITSTPTSGVAPYTFLWSNSETSQNLTALQTGSYALTITDAIGCTATISATLTSPPAIQLADNSSNVLCSGGSDGTTQITTTNGAPPFSYNWNNGDNTANISNLAAGNYSVTVTDNTLCTASASVTVTQPLPVTVTDITDQVSCAAATDGSIQLSAAGGAGPYTFLWSDGNSNQNRAGLAAGNYSVVVTDQHQCTVAAAITLTAPPPVSIMPVLQQPTCPQKEADGSITLMALGGDSVFTYLWSNGSAAYSVDDLAPGSYAVTVTDTHGCSVTGQYVLSYIYDFTLTVPAAKTIDLGQNTVLNYTIEGTPGAIASADWTPGNTLSCIDCVNPTAYPEVTTTYQIDVANEAGCIVTDTVTVYVIPQYNIFVPNAFTPNGDGRNDCFQLFGDLSTLQYLDIQIYDRVGEKVFESHDMYFQWDGTYKGVMQAPQVFAYELKMVFIDGHVEPLKKGCITLLR